MHNFDFSLIYWNLVGRDWGGGPNICLYLYWEAARLPDFGEINPIHSQNDISSFQLKRISISR